ncbi:DPB2 [Scenedesmus sp. PABB004]|nr:DPB2 [Scenedesmus sp. PABB004]
MAARELQQAQRDYGRPLQAKLGEAGLQGALQADAYRALLSLTAEVKGDLDVLQPLLERLRQSLDENGGVSSSAVAAAIAESGAGAGAGGGGAGRPPPVVFVDAFSVPRVRYDPIHKRLVQDAGAPRSLQAPAEAKVRLYQGRFAMLAQRLRRSAQFAPLNAVQASMPQHRRHAEITELTGLKGNVGRSCIVMGLLGSQEDGAPTLEDEGAVLPVDLTHATVAGGLITEGCVVVAEGEVGHDGVFVVRALGSPTCEPRAALPSTAQKLNFFGAPLLGHEDAARLEVDAADHAHDRMMFLANVWLDRPATFDALHLLFSGLQDAGAVPALLVLMGNFSAAATAASPDADYAGLREGFTQLARLIDTYPRIRDGARFVFVPGPHDPGLGHLLPQPRLASYFTADLAAVLPSAVFASNPCRIRYYGREVVVFRSDLMKHMRRRCLEQPPDDVADDPQALFGALASTVLQQACLCPLPLAVQPVHWAHDQALSLYPLPHAVVLADASPQAMVQHEGCTVFNPGCLQERMFGAYQPLQDEWEPSELPGAGGAPRSPVPGRPRSPSLTTPRTAMGSLLPGWDERTPGVAPKDFQDYSEDDGAGDLGYFATRERLKRAQREGAPNLERTSAPLSRLLSMPPSLRRASLPAGAAAPALTPTGSFKEAAPVGALGGARGLQRLQSVPVTRGERYDLLRPASPGTPLSHAGSGGGTPRTSLDAYKAPAARKEKEVQWWRGFESSHLNEVPDTTPAKARPYIPQYAAARQPYHYRAADGNAAGTAFAEAAALGANAAAAAAACAPVAGRAVAGAMASALWLSAFALGVSLFTPFSSFTLTIDFYNTAFPGQQVAPKVTVCHLAAFVAMQLVCHLGDARLPLSRAARIELRHVGVACLMVFVIIWDRVLVGETDAPPPAALGVLLAVVTLTGLLDGISLGAVFGEAALLGPSCAHGLVAGTAGVMPMLAVLRITFKAALPPTTAGLRISLCAYFAAAAAVLLLGLAVYLWVVLPAVAAAAYGAARGSPHADELGVLPLVPTLMPRAPPGEDGDDAGGSHGGGAQAGSGAAHGGPGRRGAARSAPLLLLSVASSMRGTSLLVHRVHTSLPASLLRVGAAAGAVDWMEEHGTVDSRAVPPHALGSALAARISRRWRSGSSRSRSSAASRPAAAAAAATVSSAPAVLGGGGGGGGGGENAQQLAKHATFPPACGAGGEPARALARQRTPFRRGGGRGVTFALSSQGLSDQPASIAEDPDLELAATIVGADAKWSAAAAGSGKDVEDAGPPGGGGGAGGGDGVPARVLKDLLSSPFAHQGVIRANDAVLERLRSLPRSDTAAVSRALSSLRGRSLTSRQARTASRSGLATEVMDALLDQVKLGWVVSWRHGSAQHGAAWRGAQRPGADAAPATAPPRPAAAQAVSAQAAAPRYFVAGRGALRANGVALHGNAAWVAAMVLAYAANYGVYPIYISFVPPVPALGSWFGLLRVAAYGLGDLTGKLLPLWRPRRPQATVLAIAVARLAAFYAAFAAALQLRAGPGVWFPLAFLLSLTTWYEVTIFGMACEGLHPNDAYMVESVLAMQLQVGSALGGALSLAWRAGPWAAGVAAGPAAPHG